MQSRIMQAVALADAGQVREALQILRDVLRTDRDQVDAWRWLAYLSPHPEEALRAAQVVQRMTPDDPWVRAAMPALIARATQAGSVPPSAASSARRARSSPPRRGALGSILLGVVLGVLGAAVLGGAVWIALGGPKGLQPEESPVEAAGDVTEFAGTEIVATEVSATQVVATTVPQLAATAAPIEMPAPTQVVDPQPEAPAESGSPATLTADVVVSHATSTYPIAGTTERDLQLALSSEGPALGEGEHSIAITTYKLWVEWQAREMPSTCEMTGATVHLELEYLYPEWTTADAADESLRAEWARFMEHVQAHEEHHGELALECAYTLAARLTDARPWRVCDEVEGWVSGVIDEVYAGCEQQQLAFDEVEGTTSFPLP